MTKKPSTKFFYSIDNRAELSESINLALHRLEQRDQDGGVTLAASEADKIVETLRTCASLASHAYLIPHALDMLAKNAEAKRLYKETGNPRAAARAMGWSKGKRGESMQVGFGVIANPPEYFDTLLLYEYIDLIRIKNTKELALKVLIDKYSLVSYTAAYKRLERSIQEEKDRLQKNGADTKHLDGILPPDWNK